MSQVIKTDRRRVQDHVKECLTEYRKALLQDAKEMSGKKEKRINKDRIFQGIWEGRAQSYRCRHVWIVHLTERGSKQEDEGENGRGKGKAPMAPRHQKGKDRGWEHSLGREVGMRRMEHGVTLRRWADPGWIG